MKKITIEYCVGIGLNMLFPQYIQHTIYVEYDDDDLTYFELPPIPQIDLLSPWEKEKKLEYSYE